MSTAPRAKARFTFSGVLGELLVILALLVGIFLGWKVWVQPMILGGEQNSTGLSVAEFLSQQQADAAEFDGVAPVRPVPTTPGEHFGVIYVPAFGADYSRPLISSTDTDLLTSNIGHYTQTQAPGQVGNFALAGHRTGWGDAFVDLPNLDVGDLIYIETVDGWFTYQYRTGTYVEPTAGEILSPVPEVPSIPQALAGDRVITLQTCNPPHRGGPERFIAYGTLTEFTPRADGPPEAVASVLAAQDAQ